MRIYRIADGRHPTWDGTGAALIGGRWNSPGRPVIYGSLSYSCAMLEVLAHAGIGRLPNTHCVVIAEIPEAIAIERCESFSLPKDWNTDNSASAKLFGDQWIKESRSLILLVPSVIAKFEWNVLVNPLHPDFSLITTSQSEPVIWDKRLFSTVSDQ